MAHHQDAQPDVSAVAHTKSDRCATSPLSGRVRCGPHDQGSQPDADRAGPHTRVRGPRSAAKKAKSCQIRAWYFNLRRSADLPGLASDINPIVRGGISYYGAFYGSELNFFA